MTLPLFKSHYSIGKSILTLDAPRENRDPKSPDSIFDIAQENKLDKIILIDDSFMGFLQARKVAADLGIDLVFGLRFNVCADVNNLEDKSLLKCSHKVIVFPRNSLGCAELNKIYTTAQTKYSGWLDLNVLKEYWVESLLLLGVPFYDSFVFKNLTTFNTCVPNFSFTSPTFFLEENGLPFDNLVKEGVLRFCKAHNYKTEKAHSVYYKNKKDFDAYLAYKLICGRTSFGGRQLSLEKPNFDHMGSNEFSWESYLEKK